MAQTERTEYIFTVKEYGEGTPWIMLESRRETLACLGDGFLGLDLKKGTDLTEAQEIAAYLNKHVVGIAYTKFEPKDYEQ